MIAVPVGVEEAVGREMGDRKRQQPAFDDRLQAFRLSCHESDLLRVHAFARAPTDRCRPVHVVLPAWDRRLRPLAASAAYHSAESGTSHLYDDPML